MDATITTNINTILSDLWTYLYGNSSAVASSGSGAGIQPAVVMGYSGAALSFVLSLAGAYQVGSKLVSSEEAGFFTFLEDFQDNGNYIDMIDDTDNGPAFHEFLNSYALYQVLLLLVAFWHVLFLIGAGTAQSIALFLKIKMLDDNNSSDVNVNVGFGLMLVGLLYGAVNYLAATGLEVNNDTLLQMTGFMSKPDDDTVITKGTYLVDGGTVTTTTSVTQNTEAKKDFFAMNDVMTLWNSLFMFQEGLKMILPFLYVLLLETAVVMVSAMSLFTYLLAGS